MPGSITIGGQTRTLKSLSCKVNNQWHEIKNGWAKDGGAWKKIYSTQVAPYATYTGIGDIVFKSQTAGYAVLLTQGTFRFTENRPAYIDAYLVGGGYSNNKRKVTYNCHPGMVNKCIGIPLNHNSIMCRVGQGWSGISLDEDTFEKNEVIHTRITLNGVEYNSYTQNNYSTEPPAEAPQTPAGNEVGAYNPIQDFWGRSWAQAGGHTAVKSTETPELDRETAKGANGGSSPIGGGGTGGQTKFGDGPPTPTLNGSRGGLYLKSNGENANGTGGAGGGPQFINASTDPHEGGARYYYFRDQNDYMKREAGGGNGGYGDQNRSGCGGGAQGGCGGGQGQNGADDGGAGSGVIIIRWGDSPL